MSGANLAHGALYVLQYLIHKVDNIKTILSLSAVLLMN